MTAAVIKGGNVPLIGKSGPPGRILVGVSWDNPAADVDLCALMCSDARTVVTDEHFLFWDNPGSPGIDAFLCAVPQGSPSPGSDRAQLLLHMAALDPEVTRVFVSISTIAEGASLDNTGRVGLRVLDLDTGDVLANYTGPDGYAEETCVVLGEIYLRKGAWRFRAIDQGYTGGLAALGRAYGVDIE